MEIKIMGITCKEIGKFGGMLRKVKNEQELERKAGNRKQSKEKSKKND